MNKAIFLFCTLLFFLSNSLAAQEKSYPKTYHVTIPKDFVYQYLGTTDSEMGVFNNEKTGLKIHADVGLMAGIHLGDPKEPSPKQGMQILQIFGETYPKRIQVSLIKAQMQNVGHMEATVRNTEEYLIVMRFIDTFRFK